VCDHQPGILNNTTSSLGRSLLRTWLLRPSLSIPVITARHDAVACFLRPENLVTAATMHSHLKGIKNVPRILVTMRCGKAEVGEWQGLVKVGDLLLKLKMLIIAVKSLPSIQL
jgi:DNA mismatch repair protein MSH5